VFRAGIRSSKITSVLTQAFMLNYLLKKLATFSSVELTFFTHTVW